MIPLERARGRSDLRPRGAPRSADQNLGPPSLPTSPVGYRAPSRPISCSAGERWNVACRGGRQSLLLARASRLNVRSGSGARKGIGLEGGRSEAQTPWLNVVFPALSERPVLAQSGRKERPLPASRDASHRQMFVSFWAQREREPVPNGTTLLSASWPMSARPR